MKLIKVCFTLRLLNRCWDSLSFFVLPVFVDGWSSCCVGLITGDRDRSLGEWGNISKDEKMKKIFFFLSLFMKLNSWWMNRPGIFSLLLIYWRLFRLTFLSRWRSSNDVWINFSKKPGTQRTEGYLPVLFSLTPSSPKKKKKSIFSFLTLSFSLTKRHLTIVTIEGESR